LRQRLVVDLCSEEGNHPINNLQLEASEAKVPVAGEERGNKLHVVERSDGAHFRADHVIGIVLPLPGFEEQRKRKPAQAAAADSR
jgi:hypothetical protein